ncbi:MAG: nickel-dependent lactate racemase [Anaerolineae bacterium]
MTTKSLTLPWGQDSLHLTLPQRWNLKDILEPHPEPGVVDTTSEIRRALVNPIGSPTIAELVQEMAGKAGRIAVVIDDDSRPTPVARILPTVLETLEAAGVARDAITLVTALGVHRPMRDEEVARRAGSTLEGLRWENHACDDAERLVHLGTTERGTPVYVNRTVAEADLVLSIGCIEPHLIASFGGGYKNIVPGVAGQETVSHNHVLNCRADTFNMVGQPIEHNAMRLDLEEAAGMVEAPVFIVNAVLNSQMEVVHVVAGHPIAAHRAGAEVSRRIYGVPVAAPADVVIADSYPMDQDLRQGAKSIANTIRAVRKGGVLIVLMRAEEGLGVFGLADRKLPLGPRGLRIVAPLLVEIIPRVKLGSMPDDERFYLYFALQAMRHCHIYVYAPTIPAEARSGLPFVEFVESPAEALEKAEGRCPQADVLAFPHGGSTYPVIEI